MPGVIARYRVVDRPFGRRDWQATSRLSMETDRLRVAKQRHQEALSGLQARGQLTFGSGGDQRSDLHYGTEMETRSCRQPQLYSTQW